MGVSASCVLGRRSPLPPFLITRQYLFAPYPLFMDSGENAFVRKVRVFPNASRLRVDERADCC
jgi:hypothetical protein